LLHIMLYYFMRNIYEEEKERVKGEERKMQH
jgi:hypothetical protein